MTIIEKLASLGFSNAELASDDKGTSTVKIRTAKGWVYDRFTSEASVERWANFHKPETEE
jgi:hypothetical protein